MIIDYLISSLNIIKNDAPKPWGIYFQDGATPSFEGIVELHDQIMFYLIIILFAVSWVLTSVIIEFNKEKSGLVHKYTNHGTLIELIWTISPALILVFIAFPSFKLLYLMDEVVDPAMTIKAVGFLLTEGDGLKLHKLNKIKDTKYNNWWKKLLWYQQHFISFHHLVKAWNRIGPHNSDVIAVIVGSLLGKASANKRSVEGTRIIYKQSINHKDYLIWLYDFFLTWGYCSNLPIWKYTRINKSKDLINQYYGYEFNTYTFWSFDWIYKLFYWKGKKRIVDNISSYFTLLSLAIFIMDNGHWTNYGVRIATDSFNNNEIKLLSSMLKNKFNLEVTNQNINKIGQDTSTIYINKKSIPLLIKLIKPYIHNSMYYKLGIIKNK